MIQSETVNAQVQELGLPATALTRPKVLVVDDTPANLVAMRRLLSKVDADLVEVSSGNDALAACLDDQFALILLDVQMPGMDGFEVASLLAQESETSETPIIFVTAAFADDLNRLKGYSFGAVDYIAKPINDAILLSKVRVFLDLHRGRQQLQALASVLQERNQALEMEIAERKRVEELVRHQAGHDALTGLPNRYLFMDRLGQAMERARRNETGAALLYIDIDGFKPVNDQYGHHAGDALLKDIARRLADGVRRSDTVARLGGDEFAIIMEDLADPVRNAMAAAQLLCEALCDPFHLQVPDLGDVEVVIGASTGVALFPTHAIGPDPREAWIRAADAAMYQAKHGGKNRAVLAPG